MKIRAILLCLVFIFIAALTACSKAPSDAEVDEAVRNFIGRELARIRVRMGIAGPKDPRDAVKDAEIVIGEKLKQQDGSFSVTVTVRRPKLPSETGTFRLLKGADGWVVAEKR